MRSACGSVQWWSVPLGPVWVRVLPPHVPRRGMRSHLAPSSCVCVPRVNRSSRHGTARWACAIGADQTDVSSVRAYACRKPWACQRLREWMRWCRGRALLGGSTRSAAMVCVRGVACKPRTLCVGVHYAWVCRVDACGALRVCGGTGATRVGQLAGTGVRKAQYVYGMRASRSVCALCVHLCAKSGGEGGLRRTPLAPTPVPLRVATASLRRPRRDAGRPLLPLPAACPPAHSPAAR